MKKIKIIVSSWNNGKQAADGKGYGIRVGKKNRDLFKNITKFELLIDGNEPINVSLTGGFWRNCPEFRNQEIGRWMIKNEHAPWAPYKTPKFSLTKINETQFRLDEF